MHRNSYPAPPPPAATEQPRKRRRVFLWVFLAIQVIFLIWVITGFAGADNTPAASEVASFCGNGGWQGLYDSHAACMTGYADTLKGAGDAGTAIGGGIVILFWFVTDAIVGGTYAIYRLARRPRS